MNFKTQIKKLLGKNISKKILPFFHGIKGFLAARRYKNPSKKLKIIGITGTKGKTTTTMQLGRMLNISGIPTGFISTGSIYQGSLDVKKLQDLKLIFTRENLLK